MSTWRVARCLLDLLHEVDAAAPHRAKGRDGTIGDTAHQARASRHNPNAAGVVTARDITNDPAGGMPIHIYARALIARPDLIPNDLAYVISNGQVASRESGPWTWRTYTGADPHDLHAHFGVGRGPDSAPVGPYDDPSNWHVAELLGHVHAQAATTATPAHVQEDDMYDPKLDEEIKARLAQLPQNGILDWNGDGGDRTVVWLEPPEKGETGPFVLVQRVWQGTDKPQRRLLVEAIAPGGIAGPYVDGKRIDVAVQPAGGGATIVTWGDGVDGPLPGGWHAAHSA